ncbi:hypothetical protein [Tissierella creatinophila]|uniref:Uncharacterized protein n=1 Tax=Tissierella creatinophila DSM 6911 TaxID=1123403 RepID=A0A1U7M4L1_TISCR|nr:hypothetical protein [Tissierella creatinophila]OLS02231.1 hypothetical protein TICRE_17830 [Tissierella creatinophila DSM 6911]
MADNTPFLDLYKKNPITDRNDTFNIKTMLNDNWDKIDIKTKEIDQTKVDKVIGKGLSTNDYTKLEKEEVAKIKNLASIHELALLEDEIRTHLAESMPHKFIDGAKTYKWGFRTKNGVAQFIYEEVI